MPDNLIFDLTNAQGEKLADALGNPDLALFGAGNLEGADPVKLNVLLTNWLTAGGMPKPLDPADLFGQAQGVAPVEARAAAGRGIAGLFGFGASIGRMQPQLMGGATQAPMAPNVPYAAKPIPSLFK